MRSVLWLLAASALSAAAAGQDEQYLLPGLRKPNATICTTPHEPMTDCEPNTTVYGTRHSFSGYEAALLWQVAGQMGWGKHWQRVAIRCLPRSEFDALLATGTAAGCDLLVGGINITPALRRAGWIHSLPTYHDGLAIAVAPKVVMPSSWGFMKSFSAGVWLALILTCFATALVAWVIDGATGSVRDHYDTSLISRLFDAVGRVVALRDRGAHPASGLVIVTFSFLVMIAMILLGSNITANLTAMYVQQPIAAPTDLRTKRVLTVPEYERKLKRLGIDNVVSQPWQSDGDISSMLAQVASGAVDALVLARSTLLYKTAADCRLDIVGSGLPSTFFLFDTAFVYPSTTSSLQRVVDNILVELAHSGALERLADSPMGRNVRRQPFDCRAEQQKEHVIRWASVTALWVLWAIAIGVAFVWVLLDLHVWRKPWCQARVAALRVRMHRLGRRLGCGACISDGSQAAGKAATSPASSSKDLGEADGTLEPEPLGLGSGALSQGGSLLGSGRLAAGRRSHRRGSQQLATSEAV